MKRVIIVGGGFGGSGVARRLAGRLPKDWEAVLISEDSYTTYNPMLPEVVGASVFPEQVAAPLRQVIRTDRFGRFVMGRVTGVDTAARRISFSTLAGQRTMAYDHLVLALGNRAGVDLIPGMQRHALPVKTIGDALHVRNVVLRRLAQIELEADPGRRASLGHFVVVGGGFSGVEVAGAIAAYLRRAARYYGQVRRDDLKVTVVQDIDHLLPELPRSLGAAALRILARDGVEVLLSTAASEVTPEGLRLRDGRFLSSTSVIGTVGTRPNALIAGLGLATTRGRLEVGPALNVRTMPNVWALGDCAWATNARDGTVCPPTAQFAVRQARTVADNLRAIAAGRPTRPFRYRPKGAMAAIGHLDGVADVFGLRISGLPAWLLWRAYYLGQMPTLGRKVRILVEWLWGSLAAADITHLRFSRSSHKVAAVEDEGVEWSVGRARG
jgi:NADH dehydrogenase